MIRSRIVKVLGFATAKNDRTKEKNDGGHHEHSYGSVSGPLYVTMMLEVYLSFSSDVSDARRAKSFPCEEAEKEKTYEKSLHLRKITINLVIPEIFIAMSGPIE